MEIRITASLDFAQIMREERHKFGRAGTSAIRGAARDLKALIRQQVQTAGLGPRVSNSIQVSDFPEKGFSYSPVSNVYSKAGQIVNAFNDGGIIRSASGYWLAIPTDVVGKGKGGRKLTPGEWEQRTGRKLQFVLAKSRKSAMLVAEDVRVNSRGRAVAKRGKRRQDGILSGATSAVIFRLVPQVTLTKRLNLEAAASTATSSLAQRIVAAWR